jgi:broad specificity phosphatase PhoE
MRLILVRHGNTFEPGSMPYCIGATEDLPLVEKGRQQAARFGLALKDAGVAPAAWYRGPLTRHKQFSEIAIEKLGDCAVAPVIDERFNELDYGSWAGLTDQQIKDKFGAAVHENWVKHCVYPADAGWKPSLNQLQTEIASFLDDLVREHKDTDTIVAVSSGGRLRFFLEAVSGEFERRSKSGDIKISTGHTCIFDYADGNWVLVCWNAEPAADLLIRRSHANFI